MDMSHILRKAVEVAGGQSALARQIGKTQGHISKWIQRGHIPPDAVLSIEHVTGIPRHELRPDIYPLEKSPLRPSSMPLTTQAAEGLARRRFTVAEVEAATGLGIFSSNERFELVGGDLVPMSPKGIRHEIYRGSLLDFWMQFPRKEFKIMPETTFRLDESAFLEPDFIFFDAKHKLADLSPGNTLLAVEISDASLTYDKGHKARIYARYGVKALWVVDVNTLDTHVFEQPGLEGYQRQSIIASSEPLIPSFAPELAVKLSTLTLI